MTKEQKVSLLFKSILGTKSPLKIQVSPKHLLWFFPMGCGQRKYHHFNSIVGRGGDTGRGGGARGGRGEGTIKLTNIPCMHR